MSTEIEGFCEVCDAVTDHMERSGDGWKFVFCVKCGSVVPSVSKVSGVSLYEYEVRKVCPDCAETLFGSIESDSYRLLFCKNCGWNYRAALACRTPRPLPPADVPPLLVDESISQMEPIVLAIVCVSVFVFIVILILAAGS